jgi:hypothetical protein
MTMDEEGLWQRKSKTIPLEELVMPYKSVG